jgi:type IV pilus assembly protein PilO
MTTTRVWSAGAAVAALVMVIAGWFLLISPQRSEAASLREQTVSQQGVNDSMRLKTEQLKAQFASLPERQAQLAEIQQQMPGNAALPSLIRSLSGAADAAGVTLTSIAPGAPTALTPAGPTGAAGATTLAGGPAAPLQAISTTVVTGGSYAELTLFMQKLQTMRRAFLVENIGLTAGADVAATTTTTASAVKKSTGELTMTVTGKVFVLSADAAAAPATATTPSPAASTAPSVAPSTTTKN